MVNRTRSCFFVTIKLSIPWTSHLTDTHPLERTRSLCRFFFSFLFWFLDNFEVCSVDSADGDPVSRRACSSHFSALDWCDVSCSTLRSCETDEKRWQVLLLYLPDSSISTEWSLFCASFRRRCFFGLITQCTSEYCVTGWQRVCIG